MKSFVFANWKMNPVTLREAKKLLDATKKAAEKSKILVVVAPPTLFLRELRSGYRGKKLAFAAQSAHWEEGGSFTGETSMAMLEEIGISYVLIGHAERRAMGESNEDTRKKVPAALSLSMTPILCVGERERTQDGTHFLFIKEQLRAGFADVPQNKIPRVVVAYEPVWAIGGTSAMSPRDMHEMAIFIRKTIVEIYGEKGMGVSILYGGSIDEENARAMVKDGDVSGLLVGRVSTDAQKFTALLKSL